MVSGGLACVKYLVFAFNLIFFLAGCGILGVGVWLRVEKGDHSKNIEYDYITASNLAIAAGAIIVVVTFLGCLGAIKENRLMLLLFFICLLLIFCLEIAAGGLGYANRGKIENKLRADLNKTVEEKYGKENQESVTKAVDKFQRDFECCGNRNVSDWVRSYYFKENSKIPTSCCKMAVRDSAECTKDQKLTVMNKEGCYRKVKDFLLDNLLYIGAVGIAFGVVQILGMIFAMVLYCGISKEGTFV